MWNLLRVIVLLGISPCFAQTTTTGVGSIVHFVPGSSYIGPGNIAFNGSSANVKAFWSCSRVVDVAHASTSTSLCDLVDNAAPTVVICTLRGTTSGFVDLTAYCPGSVTPA